MKSQKKLTQVPLSFNFIGSAKGRQGDSEIIISVFYESLSPSLL